MDDVPARVRVLTWNIWWRFGPHWQDRQRALVRTLREVDADVVALQEVWGDAADHPSSRVCRAAQAPCSFAEPSYPPVSDVPRGDGDEELTLGVGLLSRWPIASVERVEMPARHRPFSPVAIVARLQRPDGLLSVVVACLEYEPAYNDDRMAQAHALADLATDPSLDGPMPIIVAGDLNAAPTSPVLRPLCDVLTDAWTCWVRRGSGGHSSV